MAARTGAPIYPPCCHVETVNCLVFSHVSIVFPSHFTEKKKKEKNWKAECQPHFKYQEPSVVPDLIQSLGSANAWVPFISCWFRFVFVLLPRDR